MSRHALQHAHLAAASIDMEGAPKRGHLRRERQKRLAIILRGHLRDFHPEVVNPRPGYVLNTAELAALHEGAHQEDNR